MISPEQQEKQLKFTKLNFQGDYGQNLMILLLIIFKNLYNF